MRRLVAALPLPIALLAAAAPARAATVSTDRTCYLETRQTNVTLSGAGFAANRPYTVTLDGKPLDGGGAATDANGAMQGTVQPPSLAPGQLERKSTLTVGVDGLTAMTKFTVTRFAASFSPATHITAGSRVRFSVYGFALASPHPTIYLHYVDPRGHLRGTVRLGRSRGQCGSIPRTARRLLFPFGTPMRGKWQLQFDTAKTYTRGLKGSPFLFYTIGVTVRASTRSATLRGSSGTLGRGGAT
jgi:hypothetical protein